MSLTYRGTSSDDVHFNVTERRVYNAPAFDVTGIEVPGRSGDVLNSQERFKNKAIVYTGFIRSSDFPGDTTWERLSRGLRTIKAWVCGDAGKYHDLTDDYDPGFVRRAFVSGETAISEVLDRPDGATITITFMAEPFMYEESDPIELPETDTASGAIASFEGVAAPLQSLKFSIEPKQSGSGDPSPSNIRPISGWSQVDGAAAGANLIDVTASSGSAEGLTFTMDRAAGTITLTNTRTANGTVSVNASMVLQAGTYTLSCDGENSDFYARVMQGATRIAYYVSPTFTLTEPTTVSIDIFARANVNANGRVLKPMLNVGSSAALFAPYQGTPITISLGQTVYGGTLDVVSGKLVVDRAMVTFDGSESGWSKSGSATNGYYKGMTGSPYYAKASTAFISDKFAYTSNRNTYFATYGKCYCDTAFNFNVDPAVIGGKTLALWKAWLTANPLQVVYELATPTEVDLTPVGVNSLLGQNNIWASCGDTEAVYVEPTENPTEWPSKPRLEITMAGAGTLTVNGKTWSIGAYTGTLICDSEIMDWYDASNLKNSLVSGDGFPELVPGENVITYTGGITKVVAKPRWRTL